MDEATSKPNIIIMTSLRGRSSCLPVRPGWSAQLGRLGGLGVVSLLIWLMAVVSIDIVLDVILLLVASLPGERGRLAGVGGRRVGREETDLVGVVSVLVEMVMMQMM